MLSIPFTRRTGRSAMLVLAGTCAAGTACAQSWPEKSLTIVVPTAPGGANDAMARIIGQGLKSVVTATRIKVD